MIDIYMAGPRGLRVRFLILLSIACAIGGCWLGWDLFWNTGSDFENDRRMWGAILAIFSVSFAVGMWIYGRRYIDSILYEAAQDMLHIRTLNMFGDQTFSLPAANVERSIFFAGQLANPAGVSVDAPWFNIWIARQRWPLILDARGLIADRKLFARLLKAEAG